MLSDDASPQQEEEALALAEQECRAEMNPKEKSLHEQLAQYKHEHGIATKANAEAKSDWFEQNAPAKQKKVLGIKDCAAKVRSFYPRVYDDLDDATLTKKVLAKYPDYCNTNVADRSLRDIQGIR